MRIMLNGKWAADYLSDTPYLEKTEPQLSDDRVELNVPSYWEDNMDIFRSTPLHARLRYNPLYTLQRYPQAGYVPDMALPNPVGCFAYTREVYIDEPHDFILWMGGVQNAASAWINGVYLGRHEGYSSDFYFAIPEGTLVRGKNRITLAVSNNRLAGYMERPVSGLTSRAANECTGGIYGDVELRRQAVRDMWVTTAKDLSTFTVHTEGHATVTVLDGEKVLFTANSEGEVTFPTDGLKLWSPDSPHLYTAKAGDITRRFGIRRLTAEGTRLYLNGRPYFFRGTCEHCYHPLTVHPTRDKGYYRRVIRTLKSLGFNSIRFHTHVPMVEYIEAADELGMVMEIETPNNTTYSEWCDIVRMTRRYTAPALYSSGNEMTIDEDYVEHLRSCAELVHEKTDSLFSPMSAMRAIEYHFKNGEKTVDTPFRHNPERLALLSEFCDLYNSYSLGLTSYKSYSGDRVTLDERNAVYSKPLLSHEICINGTYIDLSLKDRYRGTRIGDTELFTSVERHLEDKGLLSRAPVYYRNSVRWQSILRKHCFETLRGCDSFAGYDFLGDIDTHWHTFGYCVGMMNEFYELKAGETVQNVRRYNSDTVLLCDLPKNVNLLSGQRVQLPVRVSNYGEGIDKATLLLSLCDGERVIHRKTVRLSDIPAGAITELYELQLNMPRVDSPKELTLRAQLFGGNTDICNEWQLYLFPRVRDRKVMTDIDRDTLLKRLERGETVVLFGAGPFASQPTSFQLSVAGRTNGHLATAIADHPLLDGMPHDGYCGRQFAQMLEGGCSVVLDGLPYSPIIEIASSYKNAHPEAVMLEYAVGRGRLFVCTLELKDTDPAAMWLKSRILDYTGGDFKPKAAVSPEKLRAYLCSDIELDDGDDSNEAANKNDITMN